MCNKKTILTKSKGILMTLFRMYDYRLRAGFAGLWTGCYSYYRSLSDPYAQRDCMKISLKSKTSTFALMCLVVLVANVAQLAGGWRKRKHAVVRK